MRDYELVIIVNPEVTEEQVSTTIDKVSQFITGRGGTVTEVNRWGKRKLAYKVKHSTEGTYVSTQFKLEPRMTAELEANLRVSEVILRHLLVRLEE